MGVKINLEKLYAGLDSQLQIEQFKKEIKEAKEAHGFEDVFREALDIGLLAIAVAKENLEDVATFSDEDIDAIGDWLDEIFEFDGWLAIGETFDGTVFRAALKALYGVIAAKGILRIVK